jgi:tRNA (cytidine/uridine-2'-O-)-methyltransferase
VLKGHIEILLYQPEIPQNTGNIGRLCAATQCRLHLSLPLGFGTQDKNLRRAGLDYWPYLDLEIQDDDGIPELLQRHQGQFAFFSTKATKYYTAMPSSTSLLIFGQETKGLPRWFFEKYADCAYKIPMFHQEVRSLNLANSVSVVLYHQLLQRRQFLGIS